MNGFLLRMSGVKLENAGDVSGAQLVLRNSDALGWVIVGALVIGALTWFSYWRDSREMIGPWMRRVLVTLRIILFLLLLLIVLRPVLAFTIEAHIRRQFVTLLDTSASMSIQDPRFDQSDLARVAMARGADRLAQGVEADAGYPEHRGGRSCHGWRSCSTCSRMRISGSCRNSRRTMT